MLLCTDNLKKTIIPFAVSSESITTCMANIHSYVLQDCNQTKWSGETEDEITMTQVKINEKKNQMKTVQVKMANRPYSKALLLENIK